MSIMQNMTLDDLKTGMIVTLRNGHECVVLRDMCDTCNGKTDVMVDVKNEAWFSLKSYNDDFKCRPFNTNIRCYDIVKVERPNHQFDCIDLTKDVNKRTLLWKEETTVKLTVAEIESRLGYKIEIVSEEE